MTDAEAHAVQRKTSRSGSTTDANHPLPQWPMAHVHPEPAHVSASEATKTAAAAADGTERDDAVMQLARALRTAERAHRAYRAELRLGDVEPADDWSTWYAEYLLGLR
jgi:predicted subunit of tRNA(5-methylaminomethyl-2-thiouridylate) methyltransferase